MKYTIDIEIDLPRARVVELFDDPDNLPKWQPGLVSFEPLTGEPGQEGATARLRYKMGKREIEMVETITKNALPEEFNGTYEAKGVFNVMRNRFVELDGNRTKWISDVEFRLSGFMRLIGWLMPGSFRKESCKYMEQFKAFAEGEGTAA